MDSLLYVHYVLRFFVLAGLAISLGAAITGAIGKRTFTRRDRIIHLVTRILLSIQGAIGIILYVLFKFPLAIGDAGGPFTPLGFFAIWHPLLMITGIVLVSVGFSKAGRAVTDKQKHLRVAIYYGLGTLVICAGVPWS